MTIYYQPDSPRAEEKAGRLSAELKPLTAQVGTSPVEAVPRLPSVLYFHPEDAAAAQELAALLGRSTAVAAPEWRVRAMPPPRSRRPSGSFEVWLPDGSG